MHRSSALRDIITAISWLQNCASIKEQIFMSMSVTEKYRNLTFKLCFRQQFHLSATKNKMLVLINLIMNALDNDDNGREKIRNKKKRRHADDGNWFVDFFAGASTLQEKHIRIENYLNIVDKYSLDDFKSHFRLQRTTVEVCFFGK